MCGPKMIETASQGTCHWLIPGKREPFGSRAEWRVEPTTNGVFASNIRVLGENSRDVSDGLIVESLVETHHLSRSITNEPVTKNEEQI